MHIPTSFFAGSTRWMAPELVLALVEDEDEDGVSKAGGTVPPISTYSDVYAFGGVALEILTDQLPFPLRTNDHAVTVDIMRGVKPTRGVSRARVAASSGAGEDGGGVLWALLDRCFEQDPLARPGMSGVVMCLEKFVCSRAAARR
jgi:serine/threonine protein kinase